MKRQTFDPNVGLGGGNSNAGGSGAHTFGPTGGGGQGGSKTALTTVGNPKGKRSSSTYYYYGTNAKKTQATVGAGTPESAPGEMFGAAAQK